MTQLQALIAKLHRERQNENAQSETCLDNIEATLDAASMYIEKLGYQQRYMIDFFDVVEQFGTEEHKYILHEHKSYFEKPPSIHDYGFLRLMIPYMCSFMMMHNNLRLKESEANALLSVTEACKGLQKAWKEHLLHDITKQ